MNMVPVIIMLPPAGLSEAESWVAEGRRAAACDLIHRLSGVPSAADIFVLAADSIDRATLVEAGAVPLPTPSGSFHFGQTLAGIVDEKGFRQAAYFGGASAPFMTESMLKDVFDRIENSDRPAAVVNNYHSTDWMVLNQAEVLPQLKERLIKDNALGWVLDHDAGFNVQVVLPSAASQVDIDTPGDLLMLHRHPSLGGELKKFLESAPATCLDVVDHILEIMCKPASSLTLIGRTSPQLWKMLNEQTQIWIRAFAEERGMIASGRFDRGEVRSLIGEVVEDWGPQRFIEFIARLSDAVLWDTRVWMAHCGTWPSTADRFAADLGWVDQINNESLKKLAHSVHQCDIPILLGGHGVVAGGIYALLESIESAGYQPSRKERQS
jgi:hypothetical protein